MFRWIFICLGLLSVSRAHADGYLPTSWGIRVTLKDGAVKTGYVDWYDGGGRDFNSEFRQATRNNPWILNYPRKDEIPKDSCGECNDQVFLLWTDFHLWLGDRSEGPGMPPNDLGLFEQIFSTTSPVTVTAFAKESIENIPFGKIRSVEMDPTKSAKIDMCMPSYDAQQRENLLHGKVLHRIDEGVITYLFYDSSFGPVEWLSDKLYGTRAIFNGKVDGFSPGKLNALDPWNIHSKYIFQRMDCPDTPMFKALAGLMEKKAFQENNLGKDRKKYADYDDKYFSQPKTVPIPGLITVWSGCLDDE
jgi:hypothetical protein